MGELTSKTPITVEGKAALRERVQAALVAMSPEQRSVESARARKILVAQNTWREAQAILFYAPLAQELDLWPLLGEALGAGKISALPCYVRQTGAYAACRVEDPASDLIEGQFGIREPNEKCSAVALDRFDLVLIPGIAFDLKGHRLGRGRGFYDRLLAEVRGLKCGVAFDQQIIERIPVEPHDITVESLLTPSRWVEA